MSFDLKANQSNQPVQDQGKAPTLEEVVTDLQNKLAITSRQLSVVRDQRNNIMDQLTAVSVDRDVTAGRLAEFEKRFALLAEQHQLETTRANQLGDQAASAQQTLQALTTVLLAYKKGLISDPEELFRIVQLDEDLKAIAKFEDSTIKDLASTME
jgi:hypothetical protein